ncbi:MAG: non-ribosomal peptide synthetase [Acidobacteriota bacterium]|nr:non-ribosomal peptide synthetase [Acidobacteriota bacterium]
MSNPISSIRTSATAKTSYVSNRVVEPLKAEPVLPVQSFVTQMVADKATRCPEALALNAGSRSMTYGELDRAANRLAHHLIGFGVGPESIVAICLDRSLNSVVSALATLKAGGAYLPLDPDYPRERLLFMLNDARPLVLITKQEMAVQLPTGGWNLVVIDRDGPFIERHPTEQPINRSTSEDLAYVIYTSGSTGAPKGVEVTHGSLMNLVSWHQEAFAVTPADRASHLAAVGFDASVWETWPYLTAGASLHLPDEKVRVSPDRLRDWLVTEDITISFLPTVLAERAMTLEWPKNTALRFLLTGADTLHSYPPATLPFKVINNYGPTECTVVATSGTVECEVSRDELPTIGLPISNTRIFILDEQQEQVPAGVAGELYIGGAGVARGYLNRPELTAEKFILNPLSNPIDKDRSARLYRTGDIARYLSTGEIAYLGRVDDQIKVMGYRIEPNEIVAVLNRHAEVLASVVVARDIACNERQLAAYVVLKPESQLTAEDLRGFLRVELPDYMVPSIFVRLESLPATRNGKVDRGALPTPDAENTLWDEVFTAPRTPLEERLATMLSALLDIEAVSVHDNFFLLGGHSLLGTQLIGQIRGAFGVNLALRSLFDAPTIGELAQEIERLLLIRVEAMSEAEALRLLA